MTGEQNTPPQLPCLIRRAVAGDAPAIENLYRELVADPDICVLPEQVTAMAGSASDFLLVATVDGVVRATALLVVCPDAMYRFQPFGVIENIIVTQSLRGHGVGRRLLAHIEHLAVTLHCTKLMLLSSVKREPAHAFFRHCGFASDTKHAFVKYRRQFAIQKHPIGNPGA